MNGGLEREWATAHFQGCPGGRLRKRGLRGGRACVRAAVLAHENHLHPSGTVEGRAVT